MKTVWLGSGVLQCIFWTATIVICYTYVGYAIWLWSRSVWSPRPVKRQPICPFISIVLVVRNEAATVQRKIDQLLKLDYPADRTEIIVASDGSTDSTNHTLQTLASKRQIKVVVNLRPEGKGAGLNAAIKSATGEIVIFTDARQTIEPNAVRLLLENFADPEVGCASGELMLGDPLSGEARGEMGLYWKMEKRIREMESLSGSVIGATGAFYAVRRNLLDSLPPETILDDVYIPMQVLRKGFRVVFSSGACAWDVPSLGTGREFARKVRTLSGNYQLLHLAPWVLSKANPARFRFVSHKLLRLTIPLALTVALVSSLGLVRQPIYKLAFALQVGFYLLSAVGFTKVKLGWLSRITEAAFSFALLNAAAAMAFAHFITGRKLQWEPLNSAKLHSNRLSLIVGSASQPGINIVAEDNLASADFPSELRRNA